MEMVVTAIQWLVENHSPMEVLAAHKQARVELADLVVAVVPIGLG